jgi:hypothetical protein
VSVFLCLEMEGALGSVRTELASGLETMEVDENEVDDCSLTLLVGSKHLG